MKYLILPAVFLTAFSTGFGGGFVRRSEPSRPKVVVKRAGGEREAVEKTEKLIGEIIPASFPELEGAKIKVKLFKSKSNYFKSRFSTFRFLTFREMRYLIYVNPAVFEKNAPEEGIRAILAHELSHVLYYRRKNRLELIGLIGLTDRSFTAKFERKTDLEAIKRGYGAGLKQYRRWLYDNVPAKDLEGKKRDYFSPEEIDLILEIAGKKPEIFEVWKRDTPRNVGELRKISESIK